MTKTHNNKRQSVHLNETIVQGAMDYYGQSNAATVPTGRSPTWFEAVNSEFFYEQNQIQDMKSNHHMYTAGVVHPTLNIHEQPLTIMATTEPTLPLPPPPIPPSVTHTSMDYYQPPIPMHFNTDAHYLSSSLPLPAYVDDANGNALVTYAPCQGPRPWNFAQCYGFYGQPACSLVNIIDMEDFM